MDTAFAFYSQKMVELNGSLTAKLRDEDRIVEYTFISETEQHGCKWDDIVFVGVILMNTIRIGKMTMKQTLEAEKIFQTNLDVFLEKLSLKETETDLEKCINDKVD